MAFTSSFAAYWSRSVQTVNKSQNILVALAY